MTYDILGICDSASSRVMSGSTPEAESVAFRGWKKNGFEKFWAIRYEPAALPLFPR